MLNTEFDQLEESNKDIREQISKIVERTAREFNVPYQSIKTFSGACYSHYKYRKKMGRAA